MSTLPREKVSDAMARTAGSSAQKNSGRRTETSRKRWLTLFVVMATKKRSERAPEARPKPVIEWIIARPSPGLRPPSPHFVGRGAMAAAVALLSAGEETVREAR